MYLAICNTYNKDYSTHLDGTPVGVCPALEEVLEEGLVEVVDGVVEGQEDELRDVVGVEAAGDLGAPAPAVGQAAVAGVATLGRGLGADGHGQAGQQAELKDPHDCKGKGILIFCGKQNVRNCDTKKSLSRG